MVYTRGMNIERTGFRDRSFIEDRAAASPGYVEPLEMVAICWRCYSPVAVLATSGDFSDVVAHRAGVPYAKVSPHPRDKGRVVFTDGSGTWVVTLPDLGRRIYQYHRTHWGSCRRVSAVPAYTSDPALVLTRSALWFSGWHRTLQNELALLDIDMVEGCRRCGEPLAFAELVHINGEPVMSKPCTTTNRIANASGCPAWVVAYGGDRLLVRQAAPVKAASVEEVTIEEFYKRLDQLHAEHKCQS